MSKLKSAFGLSIGAREEQQDNVLAAPLLVGSRVVGELLVLADGMGGHAGGQEASKLAVESVVSCFANTRDLPIEERLDKSLEAANAAIKDASERNPELKGLGATLVIAAADFRAVRLSWISVGDSHLYLHQGGDLKKLNADHSFAPLLEKQVEAGELTPMEAANHEQRNTLMSAVIGRPIPMVDKGAIKLTAGTAVMLASDGLDTLPVSQLPSLLKDSKSAKDAVASLLSAVEKAANPGQDNTSVALLGVTKSLLFSHSKSKSGPLFSRGILIAILVCALLLSGGVAGWLIGRGEGLFGSSENAAQSGGDLTVEQDLNGDGVATEAGGASTERQDGADVVEGIVSDIQDANRPEQPVANSKQQSQRAPGAKATGAKTPSSGGRPANRNTAPTQKPSTEPSKPSFSEQGQNGQTTSPSSPSQTGDEAKPATIAVEPTIQVEKPENDSPDPPKPPPKDDGGSV